MSPFGIEPETPVEERIVADPDWLEGAGWGKRMTGHPEARVADHVREVLVNVDRAAVDAGTRARRGTPAATAATRTATRSRRSATAARRPW